MTTTDPANTTSGAAVTAPVDQPVRPLTQEDVFFLIGVAYSPCMERLTDVPVALLEVAEKVSATMGDLAMVHRCRELAERLATERGA